MDPLKIRTENVLNNFNNQKVYSTFVMEFIFSIRTKFHHFNEIIFRTYLWVLTSKFSLLPILQRAGL